MFVLSTICGRIFFVPFPWQQKGKLAKEDFCVLEVKARKSVKNEDTFYYSAWLHSYANDTF